MKIGTPVTLTRAVGNVYSNFDFSVFLCFRVTTDGQARRVMRPIVWPHKSLRDVTDVVFLLHNDHTILFSRRI